MTQLVEKKNYKELLTKSFSLLKKTQKQLEKLEQSKVEPIAIVSMACRFPGDVNNPEALWKLLGNGKDATCEVPQNRWGKKKLYNPDNANPGTMCTCRGGFLSSVDEFDPQFFGISPREAIFLDPQQRLLLEVVWEALENGNIVPKSLHGSKTGVYIGICTIDYLTLLSRCLPTEEISGYIGTGTSDSLAAGRISNIFGLTGPSIAIDTACSSSLVAVHQAVEGLRRSEINMAIVGGVGLILSPMNSIVFSKANMLSPDGRCKTFSDDADGFGRAEGAGVVILKRLSNAIADGDHILAHIRGSATNQDGPSAGLTVPNGMAQQSVIREALKNSNVDPADVGYIEAHGTGTSLGDPIEVGALGAVFHDTHDDLNPLYVGALKSNVGHMEAAAGVGGLIKLVLQLQQKQLTQVLHFNTPNSHVPWRSLPIKVVTERMKWNKKNGKRIGGVSSFGFSGTNAHIIVEEASARQDHGNNIISSQQTSQLLTLSARTNSALEQVLTTYDEYLQTSSDDDFRNICYTSNISRSHFEHRMAFLAKDKQQLRKQLQKAIQGYIDPGVFQENAELNNSSKIAFLFTGQDSLRKGIGYELYKAYPVFKQALDECNNYSKELISISLLDVMFPNKTDAELINQTQYSSIALFSMEYALTRLWQSWGIKSSIMIGHGIGEYAAACIAGVFSLEDGLKLVAARGLLMQAQPSNEKMVAVHCNKEQIKVVLDGHETNVSIMALNRPNEVVISGLDHVIDGICENLSTMDIGYEQLRVSHAFYRPLMEPMFDVFKKVAQDVKYNKPKLQVVSNISGKLVTTELASAEYWVEHVSACENFLNGINTVCDNGVALLLEVGPEPILCDMGRQCVSSDNKLWMPSLDPRTDELEQIHRCVALLYVQGISIDWQSAHSSSKYYKVKLPNYPFQRQRYWANMASYEQKLLAFQRDSSTLLGQPQLSPIYSPKQRVYESHISPSSPRYLQDHRVYESTVFPASGFVEIALQAGYELFHSHSLEIFELHIQKALVLDENVSLKIITTIEEVDDSYLEFKIFSISEDSDVDPAWVQHVSGGIKRVGEPARTVTLADTKTHKAISIADFYKAYEDIGLHYGPSFRGVTKLSTNDNQALGYVQLPQWLGNDVGLHILHPVLLDACFQALSSIFHSDGNVYVPIGFDSLKIHHPPKAGFWCRLESANNNDEQKQLLRSNISAYSETGELYFEVSDLRLLAAKNEAFQRGSKNSSLYKVSWKKENLESREQQSGQRWLIFADQNGTGLALAEMLACRNEKYTLVFSGDKIPTDADHLESVYAIDVRNQDDYIHILNEITQDLDLKSKNSQLKVIYLGGFAENTENVLEFNAVLGCGGLLNVVQALNKVSLAHLSKLTVITRGVHKVTDSRSILHYTQGSLWGLGRVIKAEHQELGCGLIDLELGVKNEVNETEYLLDELHSQDCDAEIAFRAGERYVAKLTAFNDDNTKRVFIKKGMDYTIRADEYGVLESLTAHPYRRLVPQHNEVEIKVLATGINFKDVLHALGMLKKHAQDTGRVWDPDTPYGFECSGIVTTVGDGVDNCKVGDEVFVQSLGCLQNYVTVNKQAVIRKPKNLNFAQAASLPTVFLTSYYALNHLARIKKGEKVLIHAAAGGVGQAAIQLAKRVGAEVYATASPAKWARLRMQGVKHIMNSRTLDFADEIKTVTNGKGVDVILNSLNGDFITRNLEALAENGRFIEIGKLGIWDEDQIHAVRPDVSYHSFDLSELGDASDVSFQEILTQVSQWIEDGSLTTLPVKKFPVEHITSAFRYLAQAKNIGKVVVAHRHNDLDAYAVDNIVRHDKCYLITGGVGALGLTMAKWLVEKGARHLVLTRRSELNNIQKDNIANIASLGVDIRVLPCDVVNVEAVKRIVKQINETMAPLAGIFHTAGLLDDGLLLQQDWSRFEKVMAPKVLGALHLHQVTRDSDLDFFVCFSSAAALIGSPGQSNYAAANAFMDSLMTYRQSLGLQGVSINWGPWDGTGMAARLGKVEKNRMQSMGIYELSKYDAFDAIPKILESQEAQAAVMTVNWKQFGMTLPLRAKSKFYSSFIKPESTSNTHVSYKPQLIPLLVRASEDERKQILETFLLERTAQILGFSSSREIKPQQKLFDIGIDSLMAIELKSHLNNELKIDLSITFLFDYPTIEQIAQHLHDEVINWSEFLEVAGKEASVSAQAKDVDELAALANSGLNDPIDSTKSHDSQLVEDVSKMKKLKTYVFPGQGSQIKGMGGTLFDEFEELTEKADKILGYSIKELCLKDPRRELSQTQYTQPALYVVNALSYYKKLDETGQKPNFVAGHSVGEYNALLASGGIDFEIGLKLVKKRGELMSQSIGGAMAAILGLSEEEVKKILEENDLNGLDIANYNTPSQIVISGLKDDIHKAEPLFQLEGTKYIPLNTSGAFHSTYMQPAKEEFDKYLREFTYSELMIPVISNVHARPYQQEDIMANLSEQITHSVHWSESIQYLMGQGDMDFEEVGQGDVLTKLIEKIQNEVTPFVIKDEETITA